VERAHLLSAEPAFPPPHAGVRRTHLKRLGQPERAIVKRIWCSIIGPGAQPSVVLIGRLALYGPGPHACMRNCSWSRPASSSGDLHIAEQPVSVRCARPRPGCQIGIAFQRTTAFVAHLTQPLRLGRDRTGPGL
jgi:hypothetical protein